MAYTSVTYRFSQRFAVPVEKAFAWSIDYDPSDFERMGLEGKRRINKLTDDAVILDDTRRTDGGPVAKRRLIRINFERRSFTNTHISGPTPHSQFLYEFHPEKGGGSRLDFTGMLLVPKKLSKAEAAGLAASERKGDSRIWVNLAKAMEAEVR